MLLNISEDGAVLEELDVFNRFSAQAAEGLSESAIQSSLEHSGAGFFRDGHVFVAVDFITREAEVAGVRDAAWEEQLAAMLGYARSKGWLNDDETLIQIHIESAGV